MIEIHFLFLLIPALVLFIWMKNLLKRESTAHTNLKELKEAYGKLEVEKNSIYEVKSRLDEFNGNMLKELNARQEKINNLKSKLENYTVVKQSEQEEAIRQSALATKTMDAVPAPETLDDVQQQIFNKIKYGRRNIFIQGQAGTGKSAFVAYLKKHLCRNIILTAPTGVAAQNIGGSTLHSAFLLQRAPFFYPFTDYLQPRVEELLQHAELLIIDEISMVRPDILDIIEMMAKNSRDSEEAFGGLQVLLIGDLLQLPPVVRDHETKSGMMRYYGHELPFFFDTKAYKNGNFANFVLKKIYRQSDLELQRNLCSLRSKENIHDVLNYFNTSIFDATNYDDVITITPYNKNADAINIDHLKKIESSQIKYMCKVTGTYANTEEKELNYPAPENIFLKVGARVIFNRNISADCVNGTLAKVIALEEDIIWVRLKSGKEFPVQRYQWLDTSYYYDAQTKSIEEKVEGTFTQFPLQLGYALTVHKAQGKTLDKACFDRGRGVFAHGQLYVALSRTRTKADLYIARPLVEADVKYDKRVFAFLHSS